MTKPAADLSPDSDLGSTAWEPMPEIDLRQVLRMSDDTGIFQHAVFSAPDPNHGYCIDDNARALIAALVYSQLRGYDERSIPLGRYLTFLTYAFNDKTRRFRNFMGYDRHWLEEVGSQDSQGRTMWALGLTVELAPTTSIRELAQNYFERGLDAVATFEHTRSWAFSLMGLNAYLRWDPDHGRIRELRDELTEKLWDAYVAHATEDWPWWADEVTYDNAKLCHALLDSGRSMGRRELVDAALTSLHWLIQQQREPNDADSGGATSGARDQDHLSIIGNRGWLVKGQGRAKFDQQPLEAYAMVHACLAAAEVTGDAVPGEGAPGGTGGPRDQGIQGETKAATSLHGPPLGPSIPRSLDPSAPSRTWTDWAWWCYQWFLGRNDLGVPLYHHETGGCQDGLEPGGPNKNQGAESVLAYLLSVLELHHHRGVHIGHVKVAAPRTLGYAMIGASGFARFCFDNYGQIDGLKPIAVWNRTTSKAQTLAKDVGIQAYERLEDMLADPRIQLVHVATTPAQHAEHAKAALGAGKHVLCEKPIATSIVDAREMLTAARQRDRVLGVNFVMRYGPLVDPVAALLANKALGAPLRGNFANRAGDGGLPPGHWFWDESVSGGIFVEHGVHFFDLLRCWLGEASMLSAHRLRRPMPDDTDPDAAPIVDQVVCDARYGRQTSVGFYHGFTQSSHLDSQDLRLIFERGEVVLRGWVAREIAIHAVLSDEQVGQIEDALPGAQVQTLDRLGDAAAIAQRRHRKEHVDREVKITWTHDQDKQATYGSATRALMEDLLISIRDRQHEMRVTADDAVAALELALEADRIAKGVTP